jgi:hypothetical protein
MYECVSTSGLIYLAGAHMSACNRLLAAFFQGMPDAVTRQLCCVLSPKVACGVQMV